MAGEPKKKHAKSRKRTRRASIRLDSPAVVTCKNCGQPKRPHAVCSSCGFYKGKALTTPSKVRVTKA